MDATEATNIVRAAPFALLQPLFSRLPGQATRSDTVACHQAAKPVRQGAPVQPQQASCDNKAGISALVDPAEAAEPLSTTAHLEIPQVPEIPARVPDSAVNLVKLEAVVRAEHEWRDLGPIMIPEQDDSPLVHPTVVSCQASELSRTTYTHPSCSRAAK